MCKSGKYYATQLICNIIICHVISLIHKMYPCAVCVCVCVRACACPVRQHSQVISLGIGLVIGLILTQATLMLLLFP